MDRQATETNAVIQGSRVEAGLRLGAGRFVVGSPTVATSYSSWYAARIGIALVSKGRLRTSMIILVCGWGTVGDDHARCPSGYIPGVRFAGPR